MAQEEAAPECVDQKQVVPDFWYLVLQEKEPAQGVWREAGRLVVTRAGNDIVEIWHLYTEPQNSGGQHETAERIVFTSLGKYPEPERAALQLKQMGPAGEFARHTPSGPRNVITAKCTLKTETFLV